MTKQEKYSDIYRRLIEQTAWIIFMKRDGNIRVMLGTRNIKTAELYGMDRAYAMASLDSHDYRCSINNGNIALIDLEVKEVRSFNIDRLAQIEWLGVIEDLDSVDEVNEGYTKLKNRYTQAIEFVSLSEVNKQE